MINKSSNQEISSLSTIFNNSSNFPFCYAKFSEIGPEIISAEFSQIESLAPHIIDSKHYLNKLIIATMVGTSFGESYTEGIFDFPAPELPEYRCMVVNFRVSDTKSADTRLQNCTLVQFIFFIPKRTLLRLPSVINYENSILKRLRLFTDTSEINPDKIKNDILSIMENTLISNYAMPELDTFLSII